MCARLVRPYLDATLFVLAWYYEEMPLLFLKAMAAGHLWLPPKMRLPKNNWELVELSFWTGDEKKLRKTYFRKHHFLDLWYRLILEMMNGVGYPNRIRDNVLEVGCGLGSFCKILSEKCENTIGLDLDKKALNCAKNFNRKVDFVVGDAHHPPFKEEAFILVVCAETLEHVFDDEKTLGELHRVTKRSGHLLVTIPNYLSIGRLNQFLLSLIPGAWNQPKDLHIFHYLKIKKLLARRHLKILEIKGTNFICVPFVNSRLRSQESNLKKFLCYIDKKFGAKLSFLGTTIGVLAKK